MGYVSELSPDGRLVGLVDSFGRFKIWDVENKFLSRPNHYLEPHYTCLTWLSGLSIRTNDVASNNGNEGSVKDSNDLVALGKSDGRVEVYSYTTGSLKYKFNDTKHERSVTSVCWDNYSLYTTGENHGIIIVWSWRNCQFVSWKTVAPAIPTAVISLPANRLLIACKDLNMWSLPAHEVNTEMESSNIGYTGSIVTSMKMLKKTEKNEAFVLTAAKLEREIILWKIHTTADRLVTYAADFICCSMHCNKLLIAAVGVSVGATDLFIIGDMSKITNNKNNEVPNVTVTTTRSDDHRFVPIVIATLRSSNKSVHRIRIGYGSCSSLRFEDITPINRRRVMKCHDPAPHSNRDVTLTRIHDTRSDGMILLIAALDKGDTSFIRHCTYDEKLINSTVKQLPEASIEKLVEQLTLLIGRKMCNARIAGYWLKALLLRVPSNDLMENESETILIMKIKSLLAVLQTKRTLLLSRVKGQLDLMFSQMNQPVDSSAVSEDQNVLVYEDMV